MLWGIWALPTARKCWVRFPGSAFVPARPDLPSHHCWLHLVLRGLAALLVAFSFPSVPSITIPLVPSAPCAQGLPYTCPSSLLWCPYPASTLLQPGLTACFCPSTAVGTAAPTLSLRSSWELLAWSPSRWPLLLLPPSLSLPTSLLPRPARVLTLTLALRLCSSLWGYPNVFKTPVHLYLS